MIASVTSQSKVRWNLLGVFPGLAIFLRKIVKNFRLPVVTANINTFENYLICNYIEFHLRRYVTSRNVAAN